MSNEPADSRENPGRSKWRGYAQPALILVVVMVALYFARAPGRVEMDVGSSVASGSGNPVVSVIQPTPTSQSLTVELTGAVKAEDRVSIMSEVEGRVSWVSPNYSNGGTIAANEPIVRIDPAKYELQVAAAQGLVAEAEARLAAQGGSAAQAALQSAQAALGLAELELSRTEISLPYEIRVIVADASVGELVGPQQFVDAQAIMGVVYRPDALEVDAPISLDDLDYLEPVIGRTARVNANSATYDAEIVRVSSVLAPQTRLASVFFRFSGDQPTDSLPLPNTFVEVEIDGPAFENVYVLPEAVLQERDSVWVVSDGALRSFSPRAIGRTGAGLVVEAFDSGEGVVVGTLPGAREGLQVEVMDNGT